MKTRSSFYLRKSVQVLMRYPTKGKQPQTCQGDWRQRHSPRQKKPAPRYGGCHLGAYQEEERPGVEGKEGVGSQADAPPPSPARVAVAAQDNMAAAVRRPSHVLLFTLQSSVSPGVGGSGSTCCRCPLGGIRGLLVVKEGRNGKEGKWTP